jgi:hypothetical protein
MIWKNRKAVFTYLSLGALRGLSPAEGEAEKPQALKRGGGFPLFYLIWINYDMFFINSFNI